jgi:transposase-like protein
MNSQLREQAIKLRIEQNFSYTKIRKKLGVPKSTLSYWLNEFPLSAEKIEELQKKGWEKGEASREKFRQTMRKQREFKYNEMYKTQLNRLKNLSEDTFFIAGLMLYAGEGDKKNPNRINIANTDPLAIKFFIKWLSVCLDIPKERIRVQLHLYENMKINKEKSFWIKQLGLAEKQFYKSSIRKLKKSSFSYRDSFRHGTCSLYVLDTTKKREVMAAVAALFDSLANYQNSGK